MSVGGFLVKPTPIVLNKRPDALYNRYELGQKYTSFEFTNFSPWYVMVRFDWNEGALNDTPDEIIKPWSSQSITLPEPRDRVCYIASSEWPAAPNPGNKVPLFSFHATRGAMRSPPSFFTVGLQDAPPPPIGPADNIQSFNRPGAFSMVQARLSGDSFNRTILDNLGNMHVGLGDKEPSKIWNLERGPAGSLNQEIIQMLKRLELVGDPISPAEAITLAFLKSYSYDKPAVDAGLNGRVSKGGDTMTGPLTVGAASVNPGHVMRKDEIEAYTYSKAAVDSGLLQRLLKSPTGATLQGQVAASTFNVRLAHGGGGGLPLLILAYWKATTVTVWDIMMGNTGTTTIPYITNVDGSSLGVSNPRSSPINYIIRAWAI